MKSAMVPPWGNPSGATGRLKAEEFPQPTTVTGGGALSNGPLKN